MERHFFDEFIRFSPQLLLSRIEQLNPPAPDILADFQGRRIGIEITRHLREREKQMERERELILEEASQKYQVTNKPNVGVSVFWITHELLSRSNRAAISKALAAVVACNVPEFGTLCDLDWSSLPEPLKMVVDHVRIDRLIDYTASDWRVSGSGWFPDADPGHFRTAIAKKELNFDEYIKFCDPVWLLIVSEGSGPSSWCEIPEKTLQASYTTRFGRVFFLGSHPRVVVELAVQHP